MIEHADAKPASSTSRIEAMRRSSPLTVWLALCRMRMSPYSAPEATTRFQRKFGKFVLMGIRMIGHRIGILAETSVSFNSSCIKRATVTLVFLARFPTIPYHVAFRTDTSSTDH